MCLEKENLKDTMSLSTQIYKNLLPKFIETISKGHI